MLSWFANFLLGEQFVRWLGRFAEDGVSHNPSTKRYGVLIATTVFPLLAIYLAYLLGGLSDSQALLWAFVTVCVCLMVLAGFGYLVGKFIERMAPPAIKPPGGKQEGGE